MQNLLHDLAFAFRTAFKRPGTSALTVLTLALGIGINTAMFSMAWRVLLAPLPYADAERLVKLEQNEPLSGGLDLPWSVPTFDDYARLDEIFSALLQYEHMTYTVLGARDPYLAQTGIVSWNYFAVLGIQPLLGNTFIAANEMPGAEQVMLLSHDFWMTRLGGDPDVIGTSLEVQGVSRRIIGVLPNIAPYPHANDIWITAANDPFRMYMGSDMSADRDNSFPSHVFGKLREDIAFEHAEREVALLARRLVAGWPDFYSDDYSVTLKTLREEMVAGSRVSLVLLMGLALLVLLIASANLASLNLARLADRNQELAIRESVGASPSRIVRQLLTENMLLALIGGLAGLALAWPCWHLLSAFVSRYTPLAGGMDMDMHLLSFTFVFAVLTGMFSGSISVFGKRDINRALKEGGDKVTSSSSSNQRRKVLLFTQFALSFVALTVAALVILSLYRLHSRDLGYDPDRILSLSTQFDIRPDEPFENIGRRSRSLIARILQETSAIPGVEAVAILGGDPLLESSRSSSDFTSFELEGMRVDPDAPFNATFNSATAGFFEVMGIGLQSGRLFSQQDDENSVPVALVNEMFVERFIPDGKVLGQRIHVRGDPNWFTVIGVVANVSAAALDQPEPAAVYYNLQQRSAQTINVYVKSTADLNELGKVVTDVIHRLDPLQTVQEVRPLNEIKADWLAPSTLRASLITLFGVLALVLTLSGVIGVVSCNIRQRMREIGVHMALGATPAKITTMFIVNILLIHVGGVLLGLGMLLLATPLLNALLYRTSAFDTGVYLLSALLLTMTVAAAAYLPSSKAARVKPMEVLRGN